MPVIRKPKSPLDFLGEDNLFRKIGQYMLPEDPAEAALDLAGPMSPVVGMAKRGMSAAQKVAKEAFRGKPTGKRQLSVEDFLGDGKVITSEDLFLKPELLESFPKIAVKNEKGEVFSAVAGENNIFNHSDLAIKNNIPVQLTEPGFLLPDGTFVSQY